MIENLDQIKEAFRFEKLLSEKGNKIDEIKKRSLMNPLSLQETTELKKMIDEYNYIVEEQTGLEINFKNSIPSNTLIRVDESLLIIHEVDKLGRWSIKYNPS